MDIPRTVANILNALRKTLHVIARPARPEQADDGVVIRPYRGYGSTEEIYFMGRVFRQFQFGSHLRRGLGRDLVNILRRFLRWGIGNAELVVRLGDTEHRVKTDRDGYFHVHMPIEEALPSGRLWHEVDLELVQPDAARVKAQAEVFVPPASARYMVISDIDDTVMHTGVANKAKMMWRLFVQDADSRVAFPGVASFYQALHRGRAGNEQNPMLYVSRGPWSIYELLDEFFNLHNIPVGPILFLREWGLTPQRPLPRRSTDHKLNLVRDMMELYSDRPFVLIGDSGQHDPELYAQVVREYPERVDAIYIRNVSRGEKRAHAIEELAAETNETGTDLVLAADSFAMAEHAAEIGLIPSSALADVLQERKEQKGRDDLKKTHEVSGEDVGEGELQEALQEEGPGEKPPNVEVRPEIENGSTPDER